MSLKDNKDVRCFYVVKHSWKGKFRRVFSVGTHAVSTYNPTTMEPTNQWLFSDFLAISPSVKSAVANEFTITVRRGRKSDTMRFSSELRAEIITAVLHNHARMGGTSDSCDGDTLVFHTARKLHWSGQHPPVKLGVSACSLLQFSATETHNKAAPLAVYDFKDIEMMAPLSDEPDGFVIVTAAFGRQHAFTCSARDAILRAVSDRALRCVGVPVAISRDAVSSGHFQRHRLGLYGLHDRHLTSISEFDVYKLTRRGRDPAVDARVSRTLCLTESCVVERDPGSYTVVTVRPFTSLHALVRCADHQQMLVLEHADGSARRYLSTDRDALIASLMDSARAAGNVDVHVRCSQWQRGWRLGPAHCGVEEDVESLHVRFLQQQPAPAGWTWHEAVQRFNCNVPYSGLVHAVSADTLFAENKEKMISGAIVALLQHKQPTPAAPVSEQEVLEAQFHALRRLVASKAGFAAFTQLPGVREQLGVKVVRALQRDCVCVTHAAVDMLAALMQPMHADADLKQEQLNKTSILSSRTFLEKLLDVFEDHVRRNSSLVVASFLDFLTYGVSAPYSETTDGAQFDVLLEMVCARGRSLYRLFGHPSLAIVKGAGLVLRAMIEEGRGDMPARMQQLALSEAAVLSHLRAALFCDSLTSRFLAMRQLSRQLLQLWTADNEAACQLLRRVLPAGLFMFLESEDTAPSSADEAQHLCERNNLNLVQQNSAPSSTWTGSMAAKANQQLKYMDQQARSLERFIERHVDTALQHWRLQIPRAAKTAEQLARERPVVLRKRRQAVRNCQNWAMLFYQFERDHCLPHLLWNSRTREELKESLDGERRRFVSDCELSGQVEISWNHAEFEVPYKCLQNEVRVGDYYLRVLLEQDDANQLSSASLHHAADFFNQLYHRFLLAHTADMKCMCLQALAIVYSRHHEQIGAFSDCKFIVHMLDKCASFAERDRLVTFINKLALNAQNVKLMLDADVVRSLCDLLTLAHTHTDKPRLPNQSNVLEQGHEHGTDGNGEEREWYYKNDQQRHGPLTLFELRNLWQAQGDGARITEDTLCWAQGVDGGWCSVGRIPQLKWSLLVGGRALLNPTDLAVLILNTLVQMSRFYPSRDLAVVASGEGGDDTVVTAGAVIRPIPRVQRQLSSSSCLAHVVQLLLTFDPIIVEKVAVLLTEVMRDNPAVSRLYLTGVYFFILMYTGSNVLPVARFLEATHMCQADKLDDAMSADLCDRSVLSHLLPEAMICYLHNHGAEKFAQIFLGEFDTPEVIWGREMRNMLILKISCHLADYTPRLRVNTRALYQYCPIPVVSYEPLEHEVFCGRYYLRHLCDLTRFPDWPIPDPVGLLKEVLFAWRREVDKKPSSMSVRDALAQLGLTEESGKDQSQVRKAYFRLAQQHHPDKNPSGRDKFEAVNRAYDFLCRRSARSVDGPDAANIVLILRTQSILFSRFADVLRPYKYAGYPMLVKTISLETADEQLFSKPSPLLPAAAELAYYTLRCSPLNVEELRREDGLALLQQALTRCCAVLSKMSSGDDLAVQVCSHVCRCFSVAAQFSQCLDRLVEMKQVVQDLSRVVYYRRLARLCCHGVECVSAFAADSILQMHMLQAGILWSLLQFVFHYDYTLEEGGVQTSDVTNHQQLTNCVAMNSVLALARMAGYLDGEDESPNNAAVDAALTAMLTSRMVVMLRKRQFHELLKLLNVNTENPYVIWNDGMRAELRAFLKHEQSQHIRTGSSDEHFGAEFSFSHTSGELVVDGVYVRVFNEMPTFPLDCSRQFVVELLNFIDASLTAADHVVDTGDSGTTATVAPPSQHSAERVHMCLVAVTHATANNPGVELLMIGRFHVVSSCLAPNRSSGTTRWSDVQRQCISLLRVVSASRPCVDDLASVVTSSPCVTDDAGRHCIINLVLAAAAHAPDMLAPCLHALHALLASTALVRHCLDCGVVVYVLHVFCSGDSELRRQSVELLSRMLADRLAGPRVKLLLLRWLPLLFVDLLRESSANTCDMFDACHENPELLWTEQTRRSVVSSVAVMAQTFISSQQTRRSCVWEMPSNLLPSCPPETSGELVVDGVYVRLLVDNPGWVLRHPHDFFNKAIDRLFSVLETSLSSASLSPADQQQQERWEDSVGVLCSGVQHVLRVQPALMNSVPAGGHVTRATALLASRQADHVTAVLSLLLPLTSSDVCVRALAECGVVAAVCQALNTHAHSADTVAAGCHVLCRLFSQSASHSVDACSEQLTREALRCGLVSMLLRLLDARLACGERDHAGTVKAHVVLVLKTMSSCGGGLGDQVTVILARSSVWPEFRDQKHDLFLTRHTDPAALTAPHTAGYLTAAGDCPPAACVPPS